MKYLYTIGGGDPLVKQVPVYDAGTSIVKGALLMKGATDDTDKGAAVIAVGAAADVVGVIEQLADTALTDFLEAGTNVRLAKVSLNPHNVYMCEYDQADTLAETSASSTTTFNCTSLEADLAGGWLYAVTGAAAGELQWIVSDGSNSVVTKSAFTQTSGTDTFIKLLAQLHLVAKINTAGTKFGTDAAAGALPVCILDNWFESTNHPLQRLDPTKHSGLDLTGLNPRFYAEVLFRDHILNPLS